MYLVSSIISHRDEIISRIDFFSRFSKFVPDRMCRKVIDETKYNASSQERLLFTQLTLLV